VILVTRKIRISTNDRHCRRILGEQDVQSQPHIHDCALTLAGLAQVSRFAQVIRNVLSYAVGTWLGRVGLGLILLATLAIVAFLNPVRKSDLRAASQADAKVDARKAELEAGWVTNCVGPEFGVLKDINGKSDPARRAVFRINDQLVLSIPISHRPYGMSLDRIPMKCEKIANLPITSFVHFALQSRGAASPGKGSTQRINGADGPSTVSPDYVNVRIDLRGPDAAEPGAAGSYPPNVEERIEGGNAYPSLRQYVEREAFEDLHCSRIGPGGDWQCLGKRHDVGTPEIFFKYSEFPTDRRFVQIYANYYSTKYGGIDVDWHTVTSSVSNWREIDDEVWMHLDEWNLERTTDHLHVVTVTK
jgi:hypothetical protein